MMGRKPARKGGGKERNINIKLNTFYISHEHSIMKPTKN
jgi:hypothetical protein